MGRIEPHYGLVSLRNDFDTVWELLDESGRVELKTEKKKTKFVAKASLVAPRGSDEQKRAIVFFRRLPDGARLQEVAVCFECCWEYYYSCYNQRVGMYSKVLDKWASLHRK